MIRRIHIMGGPGSGKTYAARRLSERFDIPSYDLDELFWDRSTQRYGVKAPEAERDAHLMAIVQQPAWVIEGVYHRWLRPSFERADVIFVLRPAVYVRDWRILRRFMRRKMGIAATKKETLVDLWRLLLWNHCYDHDSLKLAMEVIEEFKQKTVLCNNADDTISTVINAVSNGDEPTRAVGKSRLSKQ